jgi:hypothetical protein
MSLREGLHHIVTECVTRLFKLSSFPRGKFEIRDVILYEPFVSLQEDSWYSLITFLAGRLHTTRGCPQFRGLANDQILSTPHLRQNSAYKFFSM